MLEPSKRAGSTSSSVGDMLKATYDPADQGYFAIGQGGTGATTASAARSSLGLGNIATQNASAVSITGGTLSGVAIIASSVTTSSASISGGSITGIILAVADGGTGATTASAARSNLGLGSIATQNASAVSITGGTLSGIILAITDGGTGGTTASGARSNLGLGTIATQNASAVSITGGTISGVTLASSSVSITGGTISATSLTSSAVTFTGGTMSGVTIGDYIAKSTISGKGAIITGSAASLASALAAGTNGFVLTADSAQTLGIKWAALPVDGWKGIFAGTVSNGTTTIDLYANAAGTINHLKTQLSAGTATVTLKINGTTVTGSSCSATTSIVTGTCTALNTVAVGDKIEIVIASVSSATDLAWTVQFTLT